MGTLPAQVAETYADGSNGSWVGSAQESRPYWKQLWSMESQPQFPDVSLFSWRRNLIFHWVFFSVYHDLCVAVVLVVLVTTSG